MAAPAAATAATAGWLDGCGGGGGGIDLWLGRESLSLSLVKSFYIRYSRVAAHALGGAHGAPRGLVGGVSEVVWDAARGCHSVSYSLDSFHLLVCGHDCTC